MSDTDGVVGDSVRSVDVAGRWRLCVLISECLCPGGDWWRVAQALVGADQVAVDCIQLREKTLSDRHLLHRAQRLVALCRPKGVSVIINDRPDIAVLAEADGVHLGQDDVSCQQARRLVPAAVIGVSTSNLDQAKQALCQGADYCGVGPMFPTTTKQKQTIAGPAYLRQYMNWGRLPHLAIGGIMPDNVSQLRAAGVHAVAVSRAVCAAADPAAMAVALSKKLSRDEDRCGSVDG